MEKKTENYAKSIQEHIRECIEELDEYAEEISQLRKRDFRGIERDLQVLIEAGIGVAKRLVKKHHKLVPIGAYESFQKLSDLKIITKAELKQWESVIGLRNILVHDYLNVDRKILISILQKKEYKFIQGFVKNNITSLLE